MRKPATYQTGDQTLVRQINLSLIMNILRTDAPISRASLSQKTKLNKTTVSDLINELNERGFVRDLRVRWALEEAELTYRVESTPFRERGAEHFVQLTHGSSSSTRSLRLRQVRRTACRRARSSNR